MYCYTLTRTQRFPSDISGVWAFFANPSNLSRLSPPWTRMELLSPMPEALRAGLVLTHRFRPLLGIPVVWVSSITEAQEPAMFADEQRKGPFRYWRHEHCFREIPGGTEMTDTVRYALPFGPLGRLAHGLFVKFLLDGMFAFRARAAESVFGALN